MKQQLHLMASASFNIFIQRMEPPSPPAEPKAPCLPTGMTFLLAWRDSAPTCDWKHISYKLVPYRKYVPRPKKKRVFPFPFAQNNLLRIIITLREKIAFGTLRI